MLFHARRIFLLILQVTYKSNITVVRHHTGVLLSDGRDKCCIYNFVIAPAGATLRFARVENFRRGPRFADTLCEKYHEVVVVLVKANRTPLAVEKKVETDLGH